VNKDEPQYHVTEKVSTKNASSCVVGLRKKCFPPFHQTLELGCLLEMMALLFVCGDAFSKLNGLRKTVVCADSDEKLSITNAVSWSEKFFHGIPERYF
jgi:hypothetical protein